MEAEFEALGHDDSMEGTLEIVAESLAKAKSMLLEKADEMGIDLEAAMNDPEVDQSIERAKRKVDDHPAVDLSKKYGMNLLPLLKSPESILSGVADDDPAMGEMLEIITWYQFFITVKIHGALHSLLDFDGEDLPDELTHPQSDANGRAKVALAAIERSILAWSYLLNSENASTISPFVEMLEQVGRMVEEKFPNARQFIRPGFDEIEAVM